MGLLPFHTIYSHPGVISLVERSKFRYQPKQTLPLPSSSHFRHFNFIQSTSDILHSADKCIQISDQWHEWLCRCNQHCGDKLLKAVYLVAESLQPNHTTQILVHRQNNPSNATGAL